MRYLSLFFILFSFALRAGEHALVIGGPSNKDEEQRHEFARGTIATALGLKAQGKEVTTLFGYMGIEEPESAMDAFRKKKGLPVSEKEKILYAADYEKMKKEFPQTQAVTQSTVLGALRDALGSMASGDKFTLVLNAHGHVQCQQNSTNTNGEVNQVQFGKDIIRNDFDENCHHEITIASTDGSHTTLKTELIFPILKEMEQKGIEVNAVFDSCHSGILKKEAAKLQNTCSAFLSSGDSVGYGCFESDPPGNQDYTSVTEYLKFQAYAGIAESLKSDPYFQNSECFEKVMDHAQSLGVDFSSSSISDIYWKARESDLAPQEPSLSDMLDLNYFQQGNYTQQFSFGAQLLCSENVDEYLSQIEGLVPDVLKIAFHEKRSALRVLSNRYNQSIGTQEEFINSRNEYLERPEIQQTDSELLAINEQIANAQEETQDIQNEYLQLERSLSPMIRLALGSKRSDCDRPL